MFVVGKCWGKSEGQNPRKNSQDVTDNDEVDTVDDTIELERVLDTVVEPETTVSVESVVTSAARGSVTSSDGVVSFAWTASVDSVTPAVSFSVLCVDFPDREDVEREGENEVEA